MSMDSMDGNHFILTKVSMREDADRMELTTNIGKILEQLPTTEINGFPVFNLRKRQ